MQTTLNPSEISELIKKRVEELNIAAETRNEGTVVSVSDGIARLHGLEDAMQGSPAIPLGWRSTSSGIQSER